jgi:hypothetical protein
VRALVLFLERLFYFLIGILEKARSPLSENTSNNRYASTENLKLASFVRPKACRGSEVPRSLRAEPVLAATAAAAILMLLQLRRRLLLQLQLPLLQPRVPSGCGWPLLQPPQARARDSRRQHSISCRAPIPVQPRRAAPRHASLQQPRAVLSSNPPLQM